MYYCCVCVCYYVCMCVYVLLLCVCVCVLSLSYCMHACICTMCMCAYACVLVRLLHLSYCVFPGYVCRERVSSPSICVCMCYLVMSFAIFSICSVVSVSRYAITFALALLRRALSALSILRCALYASLSSSVSNHVFSP